MGSTSAVANIIGGVIVTYTRASQIGDRVTIADTIGDIVEKTLLATRIRTIKNEFITVPNSMVLGSHIVNYTAPEEGAPLILHTAVRLWCQPVLTPSWCVKPPASALFRGRTFASFGCMQSRAPHLRWITDALTVITPIFSGLRRTADNSYEFATHTFVVRNGKIVAQSFAAKIRPKR